MMSDVERAAVSVDDVEMGVVDEDVAERYKAASQMLATVEESEKLGK
jgi:hypothetical protein